MNHLIAVIWLTIVALAVGAFVVHFLCHLWKHNRTELLIVLACWLVVAATLWSFSQIISH